MINHPDHYRDQAVLHRRDLHDEAAHRQLRPAPSSSPLARTLDTLALALATLSGWIGTLAVAAKRRAAHQRAQLL